MSNIGYNFVYIKEEVIDDDEDKEVPDEIKFNIVKQEITVENEDSVDMKVDTAVSTEQETPSWKQVLTVPRTKVSLQKLNIEKVISDTFAKIWDINGPDYLSKNSSHVAIKSSSSAQSSRKKTNKCIECGYPKVKESQKTKQIMCVVKNSTDLKKSFSSADKKLKKCEECQYAAGGKRSNLNRRIKTVHKKLKEFCCKECEYSSSRLHSLKVHVKKVHKKLKEFKCAECAYTANYLSNLRRHIFTVHKKVKGFKCGECAYAAGTLPNLTRHIKVVHRKLKEYKCGECEYAAGQLLDLSRHVKLVHRKLKEFKCVECKYAAGTLDNLNKHVMVAH